MNRVLRKIVPEDPLTYLDGDERPYFVVPSFLPPAVCELLAAEAARLSLGDGQVGDQAQPAPTRRSSQVAFLPGGHWITGVINQAAWDANSLAGWNYDLMGPEPIQFARYPQGGEYDWHIDSYVHQETARKLSVSVQLTDGGAYRGGDLQFRLASHPDRVIGLPEAARAQGSLIIFPSFAAHRVAPVVEGTRESLVAWIRGPRFR